jgi:hypothetical protein
MTRYEELAYLYGDDHLMECCGFANFLAGGLAEYLGCERSKITFVKKKSSTDDSYNSYQESIIDIVDKHQGFVYMTIAIILPDERLLGSQVRSLIRLRKVQDEFQVQIEYRYSEPHILRREDREALHIFYESLFNSFINTDTWLHL